MFVCHCAHAHHRVFNWERVGGPEGADSSDDKHVDRVLRSEKRARDVDDDQKTPVPDGGQVLGDEGSTLTVGEADLPVWSIDPYMEEDGELCLSCLVAVEKHVGHTMLPEAGETVDCEMSSGAEFVGEVVAIGLEGQGGLALNFRVLEGAEEWENLQ